MLMVCGSLTGAEVHSFYGSLNTIAAAIVNELDAAQTDASGLALSSLAELGLVMLLITLLANVGAADAGATGLDHRPPGGSGDLRCRRSRRRSIPAAPVARAGAPSLAQPPDVGAVARWRWPWS